MIKQAECFKGSSFFYYILRIKKNNENYMHQSDFLQPRVANSALL